MGCPLSCDLENCVDEGGQGVLQGGFKSVDEQQGPFSRFHRRRDGGICLDVPPRSPDGALESLRNREEPVDRPMGRARDAYQGRGG